MKNNKTNWDFRRISTTQERRSWYAHKDDVHIRGRRSASQLPTSWDDIHNCPQKTWKVKRKTQYRDRAKLNKYTLQLPVRCFEWYLTQYFDYYNIPYRIEEKNWFIIRSITYWAKKEIPKKYIDRLINIKFWRMYD